MQRLCARHALNNLFAAHWVTTQMMDEMAMEQLMQGLTNIEQDGAVGYTLNTITKLLQKHGAKTREWTLSTLPRGERWAEACQGSGLAAVGS
eukprot:COSAG01_NODE_11781_length_1859_cov_42.632955_2_plen_92_part_00